LVLLAAPLIVTIGCNPSGNSQANAAESTTTLEAPGTEGTIPLPDLQALQEIQESQKKVREVADMASGNVELIAQSAQLANKQAQQALSLLKNFIPSGDHTEFPLQFEGAHDASSQSQNKRLVRNTQGKSDIISKASKIAENVAGVGKSDPFAPPAGTWAYQSINLIPRIIEPKVINNQYSSPQKSNVVKRNSTPIQLKGVAISDQPSAILEIDSISHIVSQGDVVAGIRVIEIREEGIVLNKKGKRYNLTLSQ